LTEMVYLLVAPLHDGMAIFVADGDQREFIVGEFPLGKGFVFGGEGQIAFFVMFFYKIGS